MSRAAQVPGLASKNQRVRPGLLRGAGVWRELMTHRCKGKGRGGLVGSREAAVRRKAVREGRVSRAVRVPGLASKVQLTAFTAASESGPGLRKVFGRWNCRAQMWPGQQAALRAFASARQRCVHGVSRILVMTSTSEIRLAGDSACSLKAYVQRVRSPSVCALWFGWKPSFLCSAELGSGAEPR